MSRENISKHQNAGVRIIDFVKAVEKVYVNSVDFIPSKPPAASTYKSHVKTLDKRIIATAQSAHTYNNFDRLKICVDLRLYGKDIGFRIKSLKARKHPDKEISYVKKEIAIHRLMKTVCSSNTDENVPIDEDDIVDTYGIDESDEPLPERTGKNLYPNCGIYQNLLPTGLNAIYVKDDYFIIDVTGKWMANIGYLGYINITNIEQCLMMICNRGYVYFDVSELLKVATVRLCDVTVELRTSEQRRLVAGMSAMTPLLIPHYNTYTYKNGGLILRGTAKNTGMSFAMYDKGRELEDKRHKYHEYISTIGQSGVELAKNTLRLEAHLWRLKDIRAILDIEEKEKYEVLLSDVLGSKSKAILNVMKKFDFTEEILRDKIKGFTDEYLTPVQSVNEVMELLASIGVMSVLRTQEGMYNATRDLLGMYFNIDDDEKLMTKLTKSMRESFYNFTLYFRAKPIKEVLNLLNMIHTVYGRNSSTQEVNSAA